MINSKISCYSGKSVVLTTMHNKAKSIASPFKNALGVKIVCTQNINTDTLGTFTGEIEREGSALETARKKARLGMQNLNMSLGLASEGSFGPHPSLFIIPGTQEVMVFVDDNRGIEISEQIISTETNYNQISINSIADSKDFLTKVKFPQHGLIVRQEDPRKNIIDKTHTQESLIFKGITNLADLYKAVESCKAASKNNIVYLETDMRAHMNPTRLKVIRKLALKLASRIRQLCPACACPGFGRSGFIGGLPCQECDYPSDYPLYEIHSCVSCNFQQQIARTDGVTHVKAFECNYCNP